MTDETPFAAFTESDLRGPIGKQARCPKCGAMHEVKDSTPPMLQYVKCADAVYLVGIKGRVLA